MKIETFFNSLPDIYEYLVNAKSFHQICKNANVTFNKRNKQKIIEKLNKYNINLKVRTHRKIFELKYCRNCGKPLNPKSKNIFCNHSCSASFNNILRSQRFCLYCGQKLKATQKKYCCSEHQSQHVYDQKIKNWLYDDGSLIKNNSKISPTIKRYLFETNNSKCQLCGWSEVNPKTGLIPLQVHHLDGNCKNNNINNLQLLCPNCHSLTPTYGYLNKGNSRRYEQVKKYRNKMQR